jgi:hypothetical protein
MDSFQSPFDLKRFAILKCFMATVDDLQFLRGLEREVKAALRARGTDPTHIGLLEIKRAVRTWKGVHPEWDDVQVREGNVAHLASQFARLAARSKLPKILRPIVPAPAEATLDPRHAVAYVTADPHLFPATASRVSACREAIWGSAAPPFPWLEHGHRTARHLAAVWFSERTREASAYEGELRIRFLADDYDAFVMHVHAVSQTFADDERWRADGHKPAVVGERLLSAPDDAGVRLVVKERPLVSELLREVDVEVCEVGPVLKLPGSFLPCPVPLDGPLRELHGALRGIALETSWWDLEHSLQYVMTGEPPLPELTPQDAGAAEPDRRRKALTRRHVALLELMHRMPDATWPQRLLTFNQWSTRLEHLTPFGGPTAIQAIRQEYVRAVQRALLFIGTATLSPARRALTSGRTR